MTAVEPPVKSPSPVQRQSSNHGATPLPFHHRPGLDGTRAVAALLVVLFHCGVPFLTGGFAGVDVFFVLSGFLITSLLTREIDVRHRVNLVAFYARRVRRLLPAALLVLLVTAVLYRFLATPLDIANNRGGFVAAAVYVSNWYFLSQSQDYFAQETAPSPVLHYWSLSVEEQFYIVWPILLLILFLGTRHGRVHLRAVVAALALGGLAYAGVLAHFAPMQSYFGTLARAYQLLFGAVIALWVFRRQRRAVTAAAGHGTTIVNAPAGQVMAAMGLALVLVAASPLIREQSAFGRGVLSAIGTAMLILGLEYAPGGGVARFLSMPTARRLGAYSYTMYLWHWPVIVLGDQAGLLPKAWLPRAVIVVVVTIALSAATWRWLEIPIQRISLSKPVTRGRIAASGPIAAVGVALLLLVLLPVSSIASSLLRTTADEPVSALGVTLVETAGSTAPDAPTVLLVGDSHAGFWFEAFALAGEQEGWRVINVRRAACTWLAVDKVPVEGGESHCSELRTRALAVAADEQPDLTILVTRSLFEHSLKTSAGEVSVGEDAWMEEVRRGSQAFLSDLRASSPNTVIFDPIPETATSMNECLSTGAAPETCSLPGQKPPGAEMVEAYWRKVAARSGIVTVNLDELICPGGECPAMVDDLPTHRDSQHLTGAYAGTLMPELEKLLLRQGVDLAQGTMLDPVGSTAD